MKYVKACTALLYNSNSRMRKEKSSGFQITIAQQLKSEF
jgi:hypothetical protein